jgi:group I intron endonuclease
MCVMLKDDSNVLFLSKFEASLLFTIPTFLLPHAKAYYPYPIRQKDLISLENKDSPGIYLWYNNVNGKSYIGQASNLGDKKSGRIFRYIRPSYIKNSRIGKSLIHAAFVKHGFDVFSLVILERCELDVLTRQEQYWIDLLSPAYNILGAAKSSLGYIHTSESVSKMTGPRPYYKPTEKINLGLAARNRSRIHSQEIRDATSLRNGHPIFAYNDNLQFLGYFTSITRAKAALGITLHTVTIQKRMRKGVNSPNVNNMIWSHTPLPYEMS